MRSAVPAVGFSDGRAACRRHTALRWGRRVQQMGKAGREKPCLTPRGGRVRFNECVRSPTEGAPDSSSLPGTALVVLSAAFHAPPPPQEMRGAA